MVMMEMKPQPAEKAEKRKKASKVKRFMFWKGVGYSGRFFYISHRPSLSNAQINYFFSAKKKKIAFKLSAIEMLERKNKRKADLKEKEFSSDKGS